MARFTLSLLFAALFVASASLSVAAPFVHPPTVCYVNHQKCCFKFVSCGIFAKRVKIAYRCDSKRCARVCPLVCKFTFKTVRKTTCKLVKKPVTKCTRTRKFYYFHFIWVRRCFTKFENSKVCSTRPLIVKRKVCKRVCKRVCKPVKALCVKFKLYKFRRFCPRVICGKLGPIASYVAPKAYVGKKVIAVKVTGRKRRVLLKQVARI